MKKWISLFSIFFSLWLSTQAWGQAVKLKSTGEGDVHENDGGAVGDPLQGKGVDSKSDAGAPLTRQSYEGDCKEDRCVRAEKRQTSHTTWQQDRQSGLSK